SSLWCRAMCSSSRRVPPRTTDLWLVSDCAPLSCGLGAGPSTDRGRKPGHLGGARGNFPKRFGKSPTSRDHEGAEAALDEHLMLGEVRFAVSSRHGSIAKCTR